MVLLPESITVTRSVKEETRLYSRARQWLEAEERAPGLHASDLLDPLQAWWSRKKPLPLSDRMTSIFMIGKVLHAIVLGVSDLKSPDLKKTDTGSKYSPILDITYSPDRLHNDRVYEFKSARNFREPKDVEDLRMYLEQLLVYMAATQTVESSLWVLYLNLRDEQGRTDPAFRCYTVRITEDDIKNVTKDLQETRDTLYDAIQRDDPSKLPLCRAWKCSRRLCDWYDDCKPPGRYTLPGPEKAPGEQSGEVETVQRKPRRRQKRNPETASSGVRIIDSEETKTGEAEPRS